VEEFITNNTISNNTTSGAGGIFCNNSSPVIEKNIITYNTGCPSGGGGILCLNSKFVIDNNIISNNSGSGIACVGSQGNNTDITNNIISKNSGSGIYFSSQSSQSSLNVSKNTITYNTASGQFSSGGGGIYCDGIGTISIINNSILNNSTSFDGGGIYCISNSPEISNNVLSNNSANSGGAIYCNSSSPTLSNVTLTNNSALKGGALYCEQASNLIIYNSIVWGNTAGTKGSQVFLSDEASDPDFSYCDIQGGSSAFEINGNFFTGIYSNNLNIDPKFVAPSGGSGADFNGVAADWSLQNVSLCIDAGDNSKINYPATDLADNPRVKLSGIDIGAYEYQGLKTNNFSVDKNTILSVYPSPAKNYIIVEALPKSQIVILNPEGKTVKSITLENHSTTINLEGFSSGVYFLIVKNANGIASEKFTKE